MILFTANVQVSLLINLSNMFIWVRLIILLGFVFSRLWRGCIFFAVKGSRGEVGAEEGPGQGSGGNRFEYIFPVI